MIAALVAMFGCTPEVEQNIADGECEFTIRTNQVQHSFAKINVSHDGPEDMTWFGFLTDTKKDASEQFLDKYMEIITTGEGLDELKRTNDRNILFDDLQENTSYRYIAFELTPDGNLGNNIKEIGYVDFKTPANVCRLEKTEDWELEYRREGSNDKFKIFPKKGGRFAWSYINKETLNEWNRQNPDGQDLWSEIEMGVEVFMGNFDALNMHIIQEISLIQYYVYYYSSIMNTSELVKYYTYACGDDETYKEFTVPRLISGDYVLVVYGFDGNAQHTQTYSTLEFSIEEEVATEAYNSWLGTYRFSGQVESTDDYDQSILKDMDYFITIEAVDNNNVYGVRGWECLPPTGYDWENVVDVDWEKDIMGYEDSESKFVFPAYFNNGKLEIRETGITYLQFGAGSTYTMGMYGYAYDDAYDVVSPTLSEGTAMAQAEPVDDAGKTTLVGLDAVYQNGTEKVEYTYLKMGYIAYDPATYAYITVNPAMKFPIDITKIADAPSAGTPDPTVLNTQMMNRYQAVSTAFSTHKLRDAFIYQKPKGHMVISDIPIMIK